jgi:hypothetical protein
MTLAAWSYVHGLSSLINEGPLPEGFPVRALESRVHALFANAIRGR